MKKENGKRKTPAARQGRKKCKGTEALSLSSLVSSEEISTGFSDDAARSVKAQQMIQSQADMAVTVRARGGGGGGKRGIRRKKERSSHCVTGERGRHRGNNSVMADR